MNYIFVVMKTGDTGPCPDFFGEVVANGSDLAVVIRNPVAVQYHNLVPEFTTDFMPISMTLQYGKDNDSMLIIPKENILYIVFLQENETMAVAYRDFIERYTSSTASTN